MNAVTMGRLFAAFLENKSSLGTITESGMRDAVLELRNQTSYAEFVEFCDQLGLDLYQGRNMSYYLVPRPATPFALTPSSLFKPGENDPGTKRAVMCVIAIVLLRMFYAQTNGRSISPCRSYVPVADLYAKVCERMEAYLADESIQAPLLGEGINIRSCAEFWADTKAGSPDGRAEISTRYGLIKKTVKVLSEQRVFDLKPAAEEQAIWLTDKGRDLAPIVLSKERVRAVMDAFDKSEEKMEQR